MLLGSLLLTALAATALASPFAKDYPDAHELRVDLINADPEDSTVFKFSPNVTLVTNSYSRCQDFTLTHDKTTLNTTVDFENDECGTYVQVNVVGQPGIGCVLSISGGYKITEDVVIVARKGVNCMVTSYTYDVANAKNYVLVDAILDAPNTTYCDSSFYQSPAPCTSSDPSLQPYFPCGSSEFPSCGSPSVSQCTFAPNYYYPYPGVCRQACNTASPCPAGEQCWYENAYDIGKNASSTVRATCSRDCFVNDDCPSNVCDVKDNKCVAFY